MKLIMIILVIVIFGGMIFLNFTESEDSQPSVIKRLFISIFMTFFIAIAIGIVILMISYILDIPIR